MSLVLAVVERNLKSAAVNKRGGKMLNLDIYKQKLFKLQDEVNEIKVSL